MNPRPSEPEPVGDDIKTGNFNNVFVAVGRRARAIVNFVVPIPESEVRRHNLLFLLDGVKESWIEGVLDRVTCGDHSEANRLITSNKAACPGAVERPLSEQVEADLPAPDLPVEGSILEILEKAGRALLILGKAGSGKTIIFWSWPGTAPQPRWSKGAVSRSPSCSTWRPGTARPKI